MTLFEAAVRHQVSPLIFVWSSDVAAVCEYVSAETRLMISVECVDKCTRSRKA